MSTQSKVNQATDLVKENLKNMPRTAENLTEEAQDLMGSSRMDAIRSNLNTGVDTIRTGASRSVSYSEDVIRENPFYAILGAAALGVVVGALIRGSRRN